MLHARRPPSVYSQDDPLNYVLRPPEAETEAERRARVEAEQEAKRVSDSIDEELRQDKRNYDRSKQDVRLLLLGQAESGKSTLQKQFQLMYNPDSLDNERASWRMVVYFNMARSVKRILDVLEAHGDVFEDDSADRSDVSSYEHSPVRRVTGELLGGRDGSPEQAGPSTGPSTQPSGYPALPGTPNTLSDSQKEIATLRLRLSPLVAAEATLGDRLSGGVRVSGSGRGGVYVRRGWQIRSGGRSGSALQQRGRKSLGTGSTQSDLTRTSISEEGTPGLPGPAEIVEDIGRLLDGSRDDVKTLWNSDIVRRMIKKRRLRLEEWSEFFLLAIDRVAAKDYVPSTDDILHARIQTMGVAEHTFDVPLHGKAVSWHLYDVGGARGQRHTWVPYFDEANAIIFVAPVSAFDQYLEEDPRTNRIDDSLQLFTQICANPLLKHIHLVLFLNKTDVLQAKLDSGLKVNKYITSFGERPNDFDTVVNYFRAHFLQVHRKNNERKRVLYTHLTSVVDIKATRSIIANVRDSIFRDYLKSAALV
ncbi:G-alpha-domain-containing protein [Auriscalpium vulgare]|uniref:G-alpha-domain-containing protein n=1 Tax=Auriscalpium vulgare TaxID=40419 RepID=A0ACB8RQL7_9AGAM|nr:G-alpha-domain-containing protein [Auriscalpium vulgare]